MIAAALFCFEPGDPNTGPAPDRYVCEAYVRRMGPGWCDDESLEGRYSCPQIGLPEMVECGVVGHVASASHDPAVGELLVIWIRAMLGEIASDVCVDCPVELVDEGTECP